MIGLPEHGVYVACLASYNNGVLFGEWLDLDQYSDKDDVLEAIKEVLSKSPTPGAEEWAIHDYSGLPSRFGEWPNWDEVMAYIDGCNKCSGPTEEEAWAFYCDDQGYDCSFSEFQDRYRGCYTSGADFAEEYLSDCFSLDKLPSIISCNIDWEGIYSDLRHGGEVWDKDGEYGLHVFNNC